VIIIVTILEPFSIIIHHRSNFILESFHVICVAPFQCFCLFYILLFFLHPFNVFFFWVYLYVVVNLFNELNFH